MNTKKCSEDEAPPQPPEPDQCELLKKLEKQANKKPCSKAGGGKPPPQAAKPPPTTSEPPPDQCFGICLEKIKNPDTDSASYSEIESWKEPVVCKVDVVPTTEDRCNKIRESLDSYHGKHGASACPVVPPPPPPPPPEQDPCQEPQKVKKPCSKSKKNKE